MSCSLWQLAPTITTYAKAMRTLALALLIGAGLLGYTRDDVHAAKIAPSASSATTITVRRNIVEDGPGEIYAFGGTGIPQVLRAFRPAKITEIDGLTVSGGNGDGSPCTNCLIDFYLDDVDGIQEAFTHLGSTNADASGNFTFVMTQTLPTDRGIRTSSTTQSAGVIPGFLGGTTTEFSKLYQPMQGISVTGAISGEVGMSYGYTITVNPQGVTTPISYTVDATGQARSTVDNSDSRTIVAEYTWQTPGTKTITITAENELGTQTRQLTVEIAGSSSSVKPIESLAVSGIVSGEVGTTNFFTITVSPADVTTPLSYTIDATDRAPLVLNNSNQRTVVAQITWETPGTKTVEIRVENEAGVFTDQFVVEIAGSSNDATHPLHLPIMLKE